MSESITARDVVRVASIGLADFICSRTIGLDLRRSFIGLATFRLRLRLNPRRLCEGGLISDAGFRSALSLIVYDFTLAYTADSRSLPQREESATNHITSSALACLLAPSPPVVSSLFLSLHICRIHV